MMYTIVAPETLFDPPDEKRAQAVSFGPRALVGSVNADGRFTIERLMSSRPADYLNPALAPGAVVGAGRTEVGRR